MFDRVVFRAIGRVMRHANRNLDLVDQALQILLENIMSHVVAAASVAQQQDRLCPRVGGLSIAPPPQQNTVASEFARVVAEAQGDMAEVAFAIVQTVRNDQSSAALGKS